jgi:uncharacterized protein involved in outer membrane biogenesis
MKAPRKDVRFRVIELLTAAVLLIVLAVMLFDWNMLRHPIERRVEAATGREFHINGNLSVKLSMKPLITVEQVTLGNVPGAKDPLMASVDRMQFRLHLLKLLRGDTVLSDLSLSRPHLLLEKNAKGEPNWIFKQANTKWPDIRQLAVDQGDLVYRNPQTRTDMDFAVSSGAPSADARLAPLLIDGKGNYAGNAMKVDGRIESPLLLEKTERPYRVDVKAKAGATRATAVGTLISPLHLRGFDLKFGLSGPSLALLYPLIGVAVPDTPPYHLLGRLTHEDKIWHYDDFSGMVGDSDLSGDLTIETGGVRPKLIADLVSKRLDFDDLGGFIGAPPQTSPGETASPEQKQQAAELHASARVLPDENFRLDKLRNMDADVKLRAQHINAPSLPVEAMNAHLFVDDAVLRLDPLDFRVAGGDFNSQIRLDARKETISSSAKIRARGLHLPKLFPKAKLTEDSAGLVSGNINLSGSGNSIARMLATSNGDVGVIMGSGHISNLLMEYAGLDIEESLKFLIGKDKQIPIRCAFGEFGVDDGLMKTRALAFDTTDTVILGEGTVSLRDEKLDLVLKPMPKDHSFLVLRAPLLVNGSFKDPSFRPDIKRVTLRGLAAAFLAALAPPAALLATYETGPGKDVACRSQPSATAQVAKPASN